MDLSPFFKVGLALLCLGLLEQRSLAQEGLPARPPQFVSAEVKSDRSIVMRLWAPKAKAVHLASGDFPGVNPFGAGIELKQGDKGIWEATIPPVPAGTYRYNFSVDGLNVVDPRNQATSESSANVWSLVSVPGSEVSDLRDVPHGAVAQWQYFSKSLDRFRRVHVYTPPGYEQGTEKLPVLYLLHGAMDCDASWSTVGRAGVILDNLIAAGKARPMVVVMPMGHTATFTFGPGGGNLNKQMADFQKDFVNDLRPQVEKRYRLSGERQHRALAGLSMGGAQTLDIAVANLADYGYVGVFSSGVFGIDGSGFGGGDGPGWEKRHEAALKDAKLKDGLKLVWFATGKDDFLLRTTQATVKMLKSHDFEVRYDETDGGHTWINWRENNLPAFASQLFK